MLNEYLTNTLRRLSGGGTRQVPYTELLSAAQDDIAGLLNEFYKEGFIKVHRNINGVQIITWKGGGGDGDN